MITSSGEQSLACGICGFLGLEDKHLLAEMCETIQHRGPDHTDFYVDKGIGLGIDRLSVIDLATGDQPIHNEDGSVQIVFNGEVYNYIELRRQLEGLGHKFGTASDTETIVHGYEQWGENVLTHLRGMFAFALWDSSKRRLFLARDRFGKKPLYYAEVDGRFFFASELKAILQYEYFPREVDDSVLDYYFTYLHVPSPFTIFRFAKKLPPGHYLTVEKGVVEVKEYWDLDFLPKLENMNEDEAADRLYDLLVDSVKMRLRSDVPLGAFLSGGIDSSVVVSVMKRAGTEDVKTFSIGFHEAYYNEIQDARRVAEFVGTDHAERWAEADLVSLLPKLVWHCDEPFGDSSEIPTFLVAQETRRSVKVALTGDGGDEVFLGYPFLPDPPYYAYYARVPRPIRRAGLRLTSPGLL
jgi:asparagine synthase (glutamine-hydrolysing)